MKEGWEYKKLGDVADVIHGKNQKEVLSVNGTYPIYGSGGNVMGYASDYLCEAGSTILGRKGSINNPLYITKRFWNVDTAFGITAKDGYDGKFLYYFITTIDWLKKNTGTTLPSLTQQVVKSVTIPVPPLSEQQSIVDYLDSAFAKIDAMKANAEKALNEAKALFQASLKEMLEPKEGWEEKTLGDIGELKNGMNFNKNESGYNIHILGVGDFGNLFQIDDTDCLQTISLNSNPSEEYILKTEDIVFVRSNGNKNLVGRCVLIHVGDEPCSFSGFCIRFRKSTNEVDACYLTHFLKTEDARKKLVGNGANISNLNQKVLNEFVVSYPSLSEQQSIVATLDSLKSKVDRLQANYEKISQECDALKQAILRQVFE